MSLTHPLDVVAVVICALLFSRVYRSVERRRAAGAVRYSNLPFLIAAAQPRSWPVRVLAAAWIAAVLLVALALAGPRVRAMVPVRDGAVVLCVDTSGSMNAGDVLPTRAQAALTAMREFVDATPQETAIGIVSFAGDAQAILQPSRDRDQVRAAIDEIPAPNGATAIGDALALAQRILPKKGHRVVVLITDGENNAGSDPQAVAQALGSAGIKLYTIGIGTNSGALIPGTMQEAGIDEEALRRYAAATGGAYSRAADASELRAALSQLGRSTLFRSANVDLSLASAFAGAALMIATFLTGMAAGRYP